MDHPRFLVVGCGAVGIAYTYVLSRSVPESNIYAVCRSNFKVASEAGFTLHSEVWGNNLKVNPVAVQSIDDAVAANDHGFDYIFICTKCIPPFSKMPELIAPAVGERTSIVLLQNGISIEEPYAKVYPTNPIISVVVYVKATEVATGVVEHNIVQHLHMGTYPEDATKSHKAAVSSLANVLTSGGASITVHEKVQNQRWCKALIHCVWNPISALTRLRDGEFLACDTDAERLVETLMRETAAVASACGAVGIGEELIRYELDRNIARKPGGVQMSMLLDANAGRTMEVEVIIGNIVALGRQHGVATPSLAMLHLLAKGLNTSMN